MSQQERQGSDGSQTHDVAFRYGNAAITALFEIDNTNIDKCFNIQLFRNFEEEETSRKNLEAFSLLDLIIDYFQTRGAND
jgi:hypothetical protein